MNKRYECYEKSKRENGYAVWIMSEIESWALESGRREEQKKEWADGWHFPILCSEKNHKDFTEWLVKRWDTPGRSETF